MDEIVSWLSELGSNAYLWTTLVIGIIAGYKRGFLVGLLFCVSIIAGASVMALLELVVFTSWRHREYEASLWIVPAIALIVALSISAKKSH